MINNRKIFTGIISVSIAVPFLIGYLLITGSGVEHIVDNKVLWLPHINASLNGTTTILLIAGLLFIKNKKIPGHRLCMLIAFVLATLFLVFYVIYHANAPSTSFGGEGAIRSLYFFLLLSHILLAIVVAPLVLLALYFALANKIQAHKKIVKFSYPVWLYVSITGVLVYLLIRPYYAF